MTNTSNQTVTLELINGALQAARSEMEALIDRTSMSPFIREKKDYFTAFLDKNGNLVVSTSLTLAGNLVDAILDDYPADTMRDGDLFWYNDPYASRGGVSHLPDMVFVMPVFADGRLIAFAEAWGHLWDIGGMVPGSISPHAISTFQEGIMIPPVRVMREGVLNEEVFRIFTRNSRFPEMLKGDLKAIMAACGLGKRRMEEVITRFGADTVEDAFAFMLNQSADALRREFDTRVPDGEYSFRDFIDCDAVSDDPFSVHLTIRKGDGRIVYDFSKSEDQASGPINFVMDDSVPKFMTGLYMTMHNPNIRMNSGFERVIDQIVTRPGSIVDPVFPAPLGLRSHTMIRVNNAIFGALAQATGGQAAAASCVYVLYYLRSQNHKTGRIDLCIEGLAVGFGGRPHADGLDAVYYVAQKNYPIEFAEMEFGVRIEAFRVHRDSGGAGFHRGGCGIVRDVRVLADEADLGIRLDNCKYPAFGTNGGLAGKAGRIIVNPDSNDAYELKSMSDGNPLKKGDLLRVITSGGGGWGNPLSRPAEEVLDDILDGFVSIEQAAADYGVILDAAEIAVDMKATRAWRATLDSERGMFNRAEFFGGAAGLTPPAAE
ncbi:MAG: hydantoinase B/oxoprolinase family protein [Alphaproteobacteria bacterium]|jgi:N-methylhydantoinase B|nr:methylhydantoinase [Rhodospirillaceae bacterium]MDP6022556.1 hydantoinase B/oxoprolinase family protein [Alphaproteobacteria bacterium]MDP6256739.1 hydantoinase B/oxoprolinase family protein [Alphaproteobacteria bacterium]|tara:strand:- start:3478 stop:5280 length:1803 start_codon:yes stop_codon:yes gene_type:complete